MPDDRPPGPRDYRPPGPRDCADPEEPLEVRRVHPFQATKRYVCPGCQQEIPVGTGHVVVVPLRAPESRRHWHLPCWERRGTRRPGRG